MAKRLVQAPNTYPDWIKRELPIELDFGTNVLTDIPSKFLEVGPPEARLRYRVIEPRDYHQTFALTEWAHGGKTWFRFTFSRDRPGATNSFTSAPRGTVILLHGYSMDQRRMIPWAFRLAEEGWRCVLVDLRGHGKSSGKQIHFGLVETQDLTQLLDALDRDGQLAKPVAALGESYGAALALRWKSVETRVENVVAIAPYAELSRAILNIRDHNASFVPKILVKAGLKHLPEVLNCDPAQLDTTTVLEKSQLPALFVAGENDNIAPPNDVRRLEALATNSSQLLIVPRASHEALPYFFDRLVQPVLSWLDRPANSSGISQHAETNSPAAPR